MAAPTRFKKVGTQGRKSATLDIDTFRQTLIVPVQAINNAVANLTEVKLPASCQISNAFIKVITAEATGVTKTCSIGIQGGAGNAILDAVDVSAVGIQGVKVGDNFNAPDALTFTLGSADFVEFEGIAVIEVIGDE